MSTTENKPAHTLRDGALKATLWKNEGSKGPFYSAQFSRTFRREDGSYGDSDSFTGADLLKLANLARKAYEHQSRLHAQNEQDAVRQGGAS